MFVVPPIIINAEQLTAAFKAIDKALHGGGPNVSSAVRPDALPCVNSGIGRLMWRYRNRRETFSAGLNPT